ncbi:hypothetical protein H2201_006959 [Coniosporium apollinis]|uniref:SET domain-containing protein n=2 Tax=Coniosporium TaxID=2810619 RepID=A0ABQ9NKC9_9PEZI|nr:hypothetical protein H2199_005324 [Cladosporium sp. JES 115]KAJ9660378.1 hypothetical protein H2201_006959 [Coniosporium apollinis]
MAQDTDTDKKHEDFTSWAKDQGVLINGIRPSKIPGRGIGIVADRALKEGEQLAFVPAKALIAIDTAPTWLKINELVKPLDVPEKDVTVHGALAAYLTVRAEEGDERLELWRAVWPSFEDFRESMPMMWAPEYQELLTPPAKDLLQAQAEKYQKDWQTWQPMIPSEAEESFQYHWLIVNTRTFFWKHHGSGAKKLSKKIRRTCNDDRMVLCPFVDYFNHSDEGCTVSNTPKGFAITCNRTYEAGEEVYVSYGQHDNDFLLIEYGFVLDENKWDKTKLDSRILPTLDKRMRRDLEENSFLGDYILDAKEIDYRTQVAIRRSFWPVARWRQYLATEDETEVELAYVKARLWVLLTKYADEISEMLANLNKRKPTAQRNILVKRWEQTAEMLRVHIVRNSYRGAFPNHQTT